MKLSHREFEVRKAWLVCRFNLINGVPVFKDAGIYSEPTPTQPLNMVQMILIESSATSYTQAKNNIIQTIETQPSLQWVLRWVK